MTTLMVCVRIAGILLVGLAFAHIPIARRFRWREEAVRLSPLNRDIFLVHSFYIALTVGLMGALCVGWAQALTTPTVLGLPIAAGFALFWITRLYVQWFVYDSAIWRRRRFETGMHIFFSGLWFFLSVVFSACLIAQLR